MNIPADSQLSGLGSKDTSTSGDSSFESDKRTFFTNLATREFGALHAHQTEGLWTRDSTGKREWGNVSEHCLVEAARVQIFAELLGLDESLSSDLRTAAVLHDFHKKSEIELVNSDISVLEQSYLKAQKLGHDKLVSAGYKLRIVYLAGAVGHETVPVTEAILDKEIIDEEDIAWLIMHYVDDYTINAEWVSDSEFIDGANVNDLDRRLDKAEANSRYQQYSPSPNGEPALSAQRRVGHLVEQKLAKLIEERSGPRVDGPDLPAYVDRMLRQKIQNSRHHIDQAAPLY